MTMDIDYFPSVLVFFYWLAVNTPSLFVHLCYCQTRTSYIKCSQHWLQGTRPTVCRYKTIVYTPKHGIWKEVKGQVQEDPVLPEGRITSVLSSKITICWGQIQSYLTKQTTRQAASYLSLETNVSPAGSTFQQPMHTLTNTHTYTMLHAKASVERGEYQLSIKYMLSFLMLSDCR